MQQPIAHPDPPEAIHLRDCRTRLVWANERDIEPEYRHSYTRADRRSICLLVRRGWTCVDEHGRQIRAEPGQWIFLGAHARTQHFAPRARVISIHFNLVLQNGEPVFDRSRTLTFAGTEQPQLESAATQLIQSIPLDQDARSLYVRQEAMPLEDALRVEGAFHHWLAAYTAAMQDHGATLPRRREIDKRVIAAITLIDQHPMREKFNEPRLARQCGLSVNQLARLFKRETGLSPFNYYEHRRIELAREAVGESTMTFKEIAFDLGFGSSSHFSNWFRSRFGVNATAFRRMQ